MTKNRGVLSSIDYKSLWAYKSIQSGLQGMYSNPIHRTLVYMSRPFCEPSPYLKLCFNNDQ